ncbi:hypothetical protein Tco_0077269 [Tanacetum coccineum]
MTSHPGYLSAAIRFWGCDRLVSRALVIENWVISMAEPLSHDHVFDFPADDPAHDLEDPEEEELEEVPEEESKEEPKEGPEEVTGVSPITSPPLSESSSDSEFTASATTDRTVWMPPPGSTFDVGGPSSVSSLLPHLLAHDVKRVSRRMDAFNIDLGFIKRDATRTSDHVLALEEENRRLRRRVDSLEVSNTLAGMSQDRIEREFSSLCVWVIEMLRGGAVEARPSENIDVLVVYGESQPPGS